MAGEGRVFVRGIGSQEYGLGEFRKRQRAASRVVSGGWVLRGSRAGYGDHGSESKATWLLGPGDDPFLTQTLQVHLVELAPGGKNAGHGHQNEALFYVLEGAGYEIHDGVRYEWSKDDLVIVNNDCVHQHFNASATEPARLIVTKAKATWTFLGLWQQGRGGPEDDSLGKRLDWSRLWTPGATKRRKVLKASDTTWAAITGGRIRVLTSPQRTDVRAFSVDLAEVELTPGARSARFWHMADEVCYVISGAGHSLQWDVEAETADRYTARVAGEPSRWDFKTGDLVYVPVNTVHQFVNSDAGSPLRLLSAQNRLFKLLGYDSVVHIPEEGPSTARVAASAE